MEYPLPEKLARVPPSVPAGVPNRREKELRWRKMAGRRQVNSSFARLSYFLFHCLFSSSILLHKEEESCCLHFTHSLAPCFSTSAHSFFRFFRLLCLSSSFFHCLCCLCPFALPLPLPLPLSLPLLLSFLPTVLLSLSLALDVESILLAISLSVISQLDTSAGKLGIVLADFSRK